MHVFCHTESPSQVEVEVIQHYFDRHKPSKSTKFRHPQPLKRHEVDTLHAQLDHSPEHAADFVRDGGRDRVDRLGLGLMDTEPTPATEREERERQLDNDKRERVLQNGENEGQVQQDNSRDMQRYDSNTLNRSDSRSTAEGPADREDDNDRTLRRANTRGDSNNEEYELGRVSSRVSAIFGGGKKKGRQPSISKRFLGGLGTKTDSEEDVRPRDIEEGRAAGSAGDEGAALPTDASRPILNPASNARSNSPSRHLSLRFAPDTAESSETAPGPASYKRPAPNPSLSMYRSTSLQPGGQAPEEEASKGNQYYKRGNANPGLSMFRAQTVQVDKSTDEGGERHIAFDLPERKPKKKRW